jgi:hypothetical protein
MILYILEQPSSCSTSRIRPSWPHYRFGLSLLLVSLPPCICYHAQPSILLFISVGRVSHLMPSLLSGWLLTNVQVNNIRTLPTHGHTYMHHIGITILLFFLLYTSSTLLGRPAGSDPSWLTHSPKLACPLGFCHACALLALLLAGVVLLGHSHLVLSS